nr:hypothetical protein [Salinibacter ruber]
MPALARSLDRIRETTVPARRYGRVTSVVGLLVEASELDAAVGEMCRIHVAEGGETRTVRAEVVGVKESTTVLMPMEQTHGLQAGCLIRPADEGMSVPVGPDLLGRVIDAGGAPSTARGRSGRTPGSRFIATRRRPWIVPSSIRPSPRASGPSTRF